MFGLKKGLTALLLPPGCIIVVLLVLAWWLWRTRRPGAALLTGACALLLWTGSVTPVADFLGRGLEERYPLPSRPAGDVIILLGGDIIEGVDDLSGRGAPSPEMLSRVVTAVRLQRRLHLPVIVSGGAVLEYRTPEAPIVGRFLTDLGVPARQVILEAKSRDTVENAAFSARICAARGFRHPILVTSAYHLHRAVIAFRKAGLRVEPVPAGFLTAVGQRYAWVHYLPNARELARSAAMLREHIGLCFYALTM